MIFTCEYRHEISYFKANPTHILNGHINSTIYGEASGDQSGISIGISDDGLTVAIGSNKNDPDSLLSSAGHVRVYTYSEDETGSTYDWIQKGNGIDHNMRLLNNIITLSPYFQMFVVYDSKVMILMARVQVTNWDLEEVYLYLLMVCVFVVLVLVRDERSILNIPIISKINLLLLRHLFYHQTEVFAFFHVSQPLILKGNIVACGAWKNNDAFNDAGQVIVYKWESLDGSWVPIGRPLNGNGYNDGFGKFLSLSKNGNVLAVGVSYSISSLIVIVMYAPYMKQIQPIQF